MFSGVDRQGSSDGPTVSSGRKSSKRITIGFALCATSQPRGRRCQRGGVRTRLVSVLASPEYLLAAKSIS